MQLSRTRNCCCCPRQGGKREKGGGVEGGVLYVTFDNVGVSQAGVCGLTRTDTRPPSYSEGHFVLKERYLNSQCVEVLECS